MDDDFESDSCSPTIKDVRDPNSKDNFEALETKKKYKDVRDYCKRNFLLLKLDLTWNLNTAVCNFRQFGVKEAKNFAKEIYDNASVFKLDQFEGSFALKLRIKTPEMRNRSWINSSKL